MCRGEIQSELFMDYVGGRRLNRCHDNALNAGSVGVCACPEETRKTTSFPSVIYGLGYVNSLVYADKPQTLDHLEDNIRRVIADIPPQMLEKVIENWTSRLDYIRASRGSPMPEIIFKV
ncbi:hypothetical protein TNCV_989471 [Trichonephila clavipes]|nr:hypothetical protein TNCV_989471 [Trichonephila clavipes]